MLTIIELCLNEKKPKLWIQLKLLRRETWFNYPLRNTFKSEKRKLNTRARDIKAIEASWETLLWNKGRKYAERQTSKRNLPNAITIEEKYR